MYIYIYILQILKKRYFNLLTNSVYHLQRDDNLRTFNNSQNACYRYIL